MKRLTAEELIEQLQKMPKDSLVLFYDQQYEKAHWGITTVRLDEEKHIILTDDDWGV